MDNEDIFCFTVMFILIIAVVVVVIVFQEKDPLLSAVDWGCNCA